MLLQSLSESLLLPEVTHPALLQQTRRKRDLLMELKMEADVGGDRYNDLLLCAECTIVAERV